MSERVQMTPTERAGNCQQNQLRPKLAKTMLAGAWHGHSNALLKRRVCGIRWLAKCKVIAARGFG